MTKEIETGARTAVVILAAGKGTRMNSDIPKVLHPLAGRPLVSHVVHTAKRLNPERIVVVVGYKGEMVKQALAGEEAHFAEQTEQLGTAHAVMQANTALVGFAGTVVVLSGDVPLVRAETIAALIALARGEVSPVAFLSTEVENPSGYGRVLRGGNGKVAAIVEERDATPDQKLIKEINGGIYAFDSGYLFAALKKVSADNDQKEYYLTDVVKIALAEGRKVAALKLDDSRQILGVNRPEELEALNRHAVAGDR
ncbi:MAG: NTP transferase domain-containing protein [Nitrospinae bacterium]|nr:NTP transferase domain-containing protein [Nitrospinota bacterium]